MHGRFVAIVGVLCIAILVVSGAYADKPGDKGKPDKPRVPGQTKAECIVFSGISLNSVPGGTVIEGCCLNAGPWPEYTMDLNLSLNWHNGVTDGFLHIGSWFPGPDGGYVVQFWTGDEAGPRGEGDFMFEIWGGDVVRDRKRKLITVTFDGTVDGALCEYRDGHPEVKPICTPVENVEFVLERTSDLSYCQ